MKAIRTVLSVVGVAHLLALIALVGYLKFTDRLDTRRMRDIRQLFTEKVKARDAREGEAVTKAEQAALVAKEDAKKGVPPVTAGDSLELKLQQSQIDVARIESLKREVQLLQDTLARQRAALTADRQALDKEKNDFKLARDAVVKTESDVQFKKALATMEGLKADKAKTALQVLIDQNQTDQVIAYLDAMQGLVGKV